MKGSVAIDRFNFEAQGLPDSIINEALNYLLFLKTRYNSRPVTAVSETPVRKAGLYKGMIHVSDDFDEPLDDFAEYM